jgi:alkaline phosphatase D
VKILGIWDDHDYGMGNGDRTFKGRHQVQQAYLDFLEEPADSPRRSGLHGINEDYLIVIESFDVHLVLLDVRSEYDEQGSGDRLGPDQWAWLESILGKH